MKYVFDPSSIFKAVLEDKVDRLLDEYTDELAGYELGNIVWKKRILLGELDRDEYLKVIHLIYRVFRLLNTLNVRGCELDVAEVAEEYELTFYDAVYVYHSKNIGLPLVTEDKRLKNKVKNSIETISIDEV